MAGGPPRGWPDFLSTAAQPTSWYREHDAGPPAEVPQPPTDGPRVATAPSFIAVATGGEGPPAVSTGCPADSDPPGPLPISPPCRRRLPRVQAAVFSSPPKRPPRRRRGSLSPQSYLKLMRSGRGSALVVFAAVDRAARALGARAAGARLLWYLPRPRASAGLPARTGGTGGAPGRRRRLPWPGLSHPCPARARPPGRKAPGPPPGRRQTPTSRADPATAPPAGWLPGQQP